MNAFARTPRPFAGPTRGRRRTAFTLMEAMLATIIVGIGVTSSMALFAACTRQNAVAANTTAAMHLAQNIQETMAGLPLIDPEFGDLYFGAARLEPGELRGRLKDYDDVDDYDGESFNPPIDSTGQAISSMSQFTQVVSVWPVRVGPHNLAVNSNPAAPEIPQTQHTGAARVSVRILYRVSPADQAIEVFRTSWIRVGQ